MVKIPISPESTVQVTISTTGTVSFASLENVRGLLAAIGGQISDLNSHIDITPQLPDRPPCEVDFHQAAEVIGVRSSVGTQVFNSIRLSALQFENSDELTGRIADETGSERSFVHSALVRYYHDTGRYTTRVGKTGKKILEQLVSTLKVDEQENTSKAAT